MRIEKKEIDKLNAAEYNPRIDLQPKDKEYQKLKKSIVEFDYIEPIVWNEKTGNVVGGHQRLKILKELGYEEVEVSVVKLNKTKEKALNIALNKTGGDWYLPKLKDVLQEIDTGEFDIELTGFDIDEIENLMTQIHLDDDEIEDEEEEEVQKGSLVEKFIVPPFSVLDSKQGYWRERKSQWLSLGIRSEVGRKESLLIEDKLQKRLNSIQQGNGKSGFHSTSIFDPVLCEICYKWFVPDGGKVLDPFSGGSVRGIVAGYCGYEYKGIDLRQEQVDANNENLKNMDVDGNPLWKTPLWIKGDSRNLKEYASEKQFDFIFSCPPYFDLEVYSEDENDLSNSGDYQEFIKDYETIIKNCVELLKDDRFACFVVGDIRDKKTGFYRNFVSDTINAFLKAGMELYNECILLTSIGTGALKANRWFNNRKMVKVHQNVLVFYKGNVKNIPKNYKEINISELIEEEIAEKYGEEL